MKPRAAFVGTGWIGRHRMAALVDGDLVEPVAICDPDPACRTAAAQIAPLAPQFDDFDAVLAEQPDAVVIATPSAMHADQAKAALEAGIPVFCQKPLGRSAEEVRSVIAVARRADRLLGLDLSYRHITGMRQIADLIRKGALGRVFACDLVFHNAYGPDKDWFYDPALSGGGCVVDLGVHLVDLALWALGFPRIGAVTSNLLSSGEPYQPGMAEDYATATFQAGDTLVRLTCSWRLHAGADAVIEIAFYGTGGGVRMRNIAGSFYDFAAEHLVGTHATTLTREPEDWGGRAAQEWARRLDRSPKFHRSAEEFLRSAEVLDRIYGRET